MYLKRKKIALYGCKRENCDNAREYYAKDREFRDLCHLKRSMTKGR